MAQVAASYFRLVELDRELAISLDTLGVRERSLELARTREEGGVASLQDVRQSEVLVSGAQASVIDTRRRIEQEENLLSLLLGRNPGPIERDATLAGEPLPEHVLAGLPSELLAARPDIVSAEQVMNHLNSNSRAPG